jgi:L-2,4-diaminobutyrate decarboxylase
MMSLRFFAVWNAYGNAFFDDFVTTLYDSARRFASLIEKAPDFELFLPPESNIVCFRYVAQRAQEDYDIINKQLRKSLLEDGEFYIVATQLKEGYYLRTTFMNPFTKENHMMQLLDKIREVVKNI